LNLIKGKKEKNKNKLDYKKKEIVKWLKELLPKKDNLHNIKNSWNKMKNNKLKEFFKAWKIEEQKWQLMKDNWIDLYNNKDWKEKRNKMKNGVKNSKPE
jgi:hypothetical protein